MKHIARSQSQRRFFSSYHKLGSSATPVSKMQSQLWFEALFGVPEPKTRAEVHQLFEVSDDGSKLTSKANFKQFQVGYFSTPTVHQLKGDTLDSLRSSSPDAAALPLSESIGEQAIKERQYNYIEFEHIIVGDAFELHAQNLGAVFQVASQFNCLEFSSPRALPEHGVENYKYDNTQGPACALACAAGTVYRNYFAPCVRSSDGQVQIGQSQDCQINNLDLLESEVNNSEHQYWNIENGYTSSVDSRNLGDLNVMLRNLSHEERTAYIGKIKIGLQRNVGVDFAKRYVPLLGLQPEKAMSSSNNNTDVPFTVTQAYCSAVSCAYAGHDVSMWSSLAILVLHAMYEATLWAAVQNFIGYPPTCSSSSSNSKSCDTSTSLNTKRDTVFLTFIGGGVFGNKTEWIASAIGRSMAEIQHNCSVVGASFPEGRPLKVKICHYRCINESMVDAVSESYAEYSEALHLTGTV